MLILSDLESFFSQLIRKICPFFGKCKKKGKKREKKLELFFFSKSFYENFVQISFGRNFQQKIHFLRDFFPKDLFCSNYIPISFGSWIFRKILRCFLIFLEKKFCQGFLGKYGILEKDWEVLKTFIGSDSFPKNSTTKNFLNFICDFFGKIFLEIIWEIFPQISSLSGLHSLWLFFFIVRLP